MRRAIPLIWLALLIFPLLVPAQTSIHENAGTRALTFLKLGVGAEAIAMGESHAAAADDVYATYWNPAGLSKIQQGQLGFMHNEWFAGIRHEYLAYAQPVGESSAIAVSASYLSYGTLERRDDQGSSLGTFRPYDLSAAASFAASLSEQIALGVNGKWVQEQIDEQSAQALAFDLGAVYSMANAPVTLGLNAQHLGTKVKYDEESFLLPFNLKAGASYHADSVEFVADVNRPSDDNVSAGFGASLLVADMFHLRSGYRYRFGGNPLGGLSGLSLGLGLSVEGYRLDYAFASLGKLGPVHRISLLTSF